uniref:complement factor H-related protein 2-like n=1 Tax=Semicossyphus pulcher TaxID=241346 RepID=UPI0037E88495
MCVRYLGFVLLVWFPGVLHAQIAAQPCRAPNLNDGYFVPERDSYSEGTTLTYSCDSGLKPAVEGWWASSKCQNSTWFPEPQCIDEKACTPLTIPNAGHTENSNGWFEQGHRIRITCDEGYELKNLDNTAICLNGRWSSVPVCEKSGHACGEPPKIPHAVIIGRRYQEVFARDSKVQYECEDGFTANGIKSIFCLSGDWTEGPTCNKILDMVALRWGEYLEDTLHLLTVGRKLWVEAEEPTLDTVDLQWEEQVADTLHPPAVGHNLWVEAEQQGQILEMMDPQLEEQVVDMVDPLAV